MGVAFLVGAKVGARNGNAGIEESQFAHAVGEDVVFVVRGDENAAVGPELLTGAAELCGPHNLDIVKGLAFLVFLLIDLAIAEYLAEHVCAQCVDAANTHAMQTA